MQDLLIFIIWISILGYWIYLHFSFWQALKTEDPEMYRSNSSWSPLKYSAGFAWIDLALTNKHVNSNSKSVVLKGNRLRHAYDIKFKIIGFGLLFSLVVFVIAVSFGVIST
jgi:hypothetical protein